MYKLYLEKVKEPEIKLPTSVGSFKNQENSRKTSTSALLTMPKPLTVWITTNCEKFLEMGIPDHLTHLLRNLYAGQKQQLEPDMEQWTDSKLGKEYIKTLYCHPAYLYAEYIIWNPKLDETQARKENTGRNINSLRYADDTTFMAES